ncbi:hypothetical protein DL764_000228 [Monosporascus ibericus]|uniref:Uncharacterized protein n=1 Tax=Monosporascus ibericus TaxID=155417 RepID=A0A4Q4TXW8_9PEZI|nr:hypothetical protein DL764_000228 [Monosporascus ibericus]
MSSTSHFSQHNPFSSKTPYTSQKSARRATAAPLAGRNETQQPAPVASPANANYPHRPFIKMPGQKRDDATKAARQTAARGATGPEPPSSRHPLQSETIRTEITPLSQVEWEDIADDSNNLLDEGTKYVIDCFIDVQQSMSELEQAVRKSVYRRRLSAGVEAASEGIDCFNQNLRSVIERVMRQE